MTYWQVDSGQFVSRGHLYLREESPPHLSEQPVGCHLLQKKTKMEPLDERRVNHKGGMKATVSHRRSQQTFVSTPSKIQPNQKCPHSISDNSRCIAVEEEKRLTQDREVWTYSKLAVAILNSRFWLQFHLAAFEDSLQLPEDLHHQRVVSWDTKGATEDEENRGLRRSLLLGTKHFPSPAPAIG